MFFKHTSKHQLNIQSSNAMVSSYATLKVAGDMVSRTVGFTKNDGARERHKQIKKFKMDISHKALEYLGT